MSFFGIFDIAGSALKAQNIRLNTVASNMANADSASTTAEQAYRARQPVFESMLMHQIGAQKLSGVNVRSIETSTAAPRKEYQPDHPLANEEGYVFYSNVNSIEEMANMISASRSYQNSLKVIDNAKQMLMQTLRLGQQ